jgi:hypothetical protein
MVIWQQYSTSLERGEFWEAFHHWVEWRDFLVSEYTTTTTHTHRTHPQAHTHTLPTHTVIYTTITYTHYIESVIQIGHNMIRHICKYTCRMHLRMRVRGLLSLYSILSQSDVLCNEMSMKRLRGVCVCMTSFHTCRGP